MNYNGIKSTHTDSVTQVVKYDSILHFNKNPNIDMYSILLQCFVLLNNDVHIVSNIYIDIMENYTILSYKLSNGKYLHLKTRFIVKFYNILATDSLDFQTNPSFETFYNMMLKLVTNYPRYSNFIVSVLQICINNDKIIEYILKEYDEIENLLIEIFGTDMDNIDQSNISTTIKELLYVFLNHYGSVFSVLQIPT